MNILQKVGERKLFGLLLVLLGLAMQGAAMFMLRGHNLMLASGFVVVVLGAIIWVRQQK